MKTKVFFYITCALIPFASIAAEPFVISADYHIVNQNTGTVEHIGNVVIDKGGLHLEADHVTEYRENGKIVRIVATGSPTVFEQNQIQENQIAKGQAKKIEYLVASNQLLMNDYSITDVDGNVQRGKQGKYLLAH